MRIPTWGGRLALVALGFLLGLAAVLGSYLLALDAPALEGPAPALETEDIPVGRLLLYRADVIAEARTWCGRITTPADTQRSRRSPTPCAGSGSRAFGDLDAA